MDVCQVAQEKKALPRYPRVEPFVGDMYASRYSQMGTIGEIIEDFSDPIQRHTYPGKAGDMYVSSYQKGVIGQMETIGKIPDDPTLKENFRDNLSLSPKEKLRLKLRELAQQRKKK